MDQPSFQTSPRPARREGGFSLVEVSLSVAIVGFGFAGLLGLMTSGLTQFRTSMDATISAQIAQRVLADAQQADFTVLVDAAALGKKQPDPQFTFRAPRVDAPAFRFFDAQGDELHAEPEGGLSPAEATAAVYQVNVRVRPFAQVPRAAQVTQPQLAQVTVQVAHLPAAQPFGVETEAGPRQNLFKARPSAAIYTFAALVGRNE